MATVAAVVAAAVLVMAATVVLDVSHHRPAPSSLAPVRVRPGSLTTSLHPGFPAAARAIDARPRPEPGWVERTSHLTVDAIPRSYLLVRPSTRVEGERLPVLVVLHGRSMTPEVVAEVTGFLPVVGRAILVYPAGYGLSWNAGACCGESHAAEVDDVTFLTAVVHDVLATEPDASARAVFLAGYSNGGRMAYRMACVTPELFAAVASAEAISVYPCARPKPMRVIEVASTDDPLLVIGTEQPHKVVDGFPEPSVADVVSSWRAAGACTPASAVTLAGPLTTTRWDECAPGGAVELDLYKGGSHAWPDGGDGVPSAQRQIWRFFQATSPSASPS